LITAVLICVMSHIGLGYDYCTRSVNLHRLVLDLVRMAMWQETGGKWHQDLHKRYSPPEATCKSVTGESRYRGWTDSRRSWDMSKEDVVHEGKVMKQWLWWRTATLWLSLKLEWC